MKRIVAMALLVSACTAPVSVSATTTTAESIPDPTPETTTQSPAVGEVGATGVGDRLYPDLGNGGYDVQSYRFQLVFSPTFDLDAVALIELIPSVDLSAFFLDLAGLDVTAVSIDGFSDVGFEHIGRELVVTLGAEVASEGTPITVEVAYSGQPRSVPEAAVPFGPGWQPRPSLAYLFSQPDGAQSLFPVNDHPIDRADVTLEVTVPTGLEAVSGGAIASESSGDATDTVVWELENVAPYAIPLAVGEFTLVSDQTVDGVRYDVWVSDSLIELPAIDVFDVQPEIIEFFEERFGPYPFDRAGALVVDDDLGAALETQTIPTYTATSVQWGELVIAHELAHQWFGDAISLVQWDDIWLNEGFATFAHWLWLEERFGVERYDAEIADAHRMFSGVDLVESGVTAEVARRRVRDAFPPPDDPKAADLFNPSVYERGGLALVALRDEIGDDRLFEFIRRYTSRYVGSEVTTEDFLTFATAELGDAEAQLLAAWILDPEIPALPTRGLDLPR